MPLESARSFHHSSLLSPSAPSKKLKRRISGTPLQFQPDLFVLAASRKERKKQDSTSAPIRFSAPIEHAPAPSTLGIPVSQWSSIRGRQPCTARQGQALHGH